MKTLYFMILAGVLSVVSAAERTLDTERPRAAEN